MVDKKDFIKKKVAAGKLNFFNSPEPPPAISKVCIIREFQVNGRKVFSLSPKNSHDSGKCILYFHGGAYIQNFVIFHWKFLAELVKKTGCTIIAPDYPLAPQFTYKESFAMADVLYKQLLLNVNPKDLILMGDSAGGGFALALAQKIRNEQIDQPGQVILLSPWLDITLSNPDIKAVRGIGPFLGIEGLQEAGRIYAGDAGPDHYLLSPINGSLEGLGKISVFIGTRDILVADARKFKQLTGSMGIEINYHEYEDMLHAWMFLNFPESKKARQQIIDLVKCPVSQPY